MEIRKRLEGKAAGQNYKVYITPKGTHCWTKTLLGNNGRFVEHFAIGESLSGKTHMVYMVTLWYLRGAAILAGFTAFDELAEILSEEPQG